VCLDFAEAVVIPTCVTVCVVLVVGIVEVYVGFGCVYCRNINVGYSKGYCITLLNQYNTAVFTEVNLTLLYQPIYYIIYYYYLYRTSYWQVVLASFVSRR
jgi:hypothetical protein